MSLIRSFMLVKPSPCPLIAFCRSKPTPESCTLNWISFDAALSNTSNCRAPLCLTAFWRASCKTRKRLSCHFAPGDVNTKSDKTWARKGLFCLFAPGDVNTKSDKTCKGAVGVEPRHAVIENPAIFSVMSPQPILHLERLAPIERLRIGL